MNKQLIRNICAWSAFIILAGCSAAPILNGDMPTSVSLNLGTGPSVMGTSLNGSSSRFLASDNASANIVVRTAGSPDLNYSFNPNAGTVTIQVERGLHTFIVNTYDSSGNLLTSGTRTLDVGSGSNSLSLTLNPAVVGVSGTPINLAAGQVIYFSVPGNTYIVNGNCLNNAGGYAIKFWLCAANGSYTGNPSPTQYILPPYTASPSLIRAQNTGLAGTLTF